MGRAKKPFGRPKGSKNQEYAVVQIVPAQCPQCRSTELRVIPGGRGVAVQRDWIGYYEGKRYDRIVWKNTRCKGCGQLIRIISYEEISKETTKPPGGTVENDDANALE